MLAPGLAVAAVLAKATLMLGAVAATAAVCVAYSTQATKAMVQVSPASKLLVPPKRAILALPSNAALGAAQAVPLLVMAKLVGLMLTAAVAGKAAVSLSTSCTWVAGGVLVFFTTKV